MKIGLLLIGILTIAACAAQAVIIENVPFVTQAPYANWDDPVFHEGCEEAAIVMAMGWVQGEKIISAEQANHDIQALADYELDNYGFYLDSSAADTKRLIVDYYHYSNIEFVPDIGTDDIIAELEHGNLVLIPINGRVVTNPYFTPPGPLRHMIVIFGYDFKTHQFIAHEPGTVQGEALRYSKEIIEKGIQDYASGFAEPRESIEKNMIVVKPLPLELFQ